MTLARTRPSQPAGEESERAPRAYRGSVLNARLEPQDDDDIQV